MCPSVSPGPVVLLPRAGRPQAERLRPARRPHLRQLRAAGLREERSPAGGRARPRDRARVEGHTLDAIRKQRGSEKRNKIIGAATGAAPIADAVSAILQGKYSREQEKEADLIGAEIAMASGFDPQAGVSLFEKLHRLYGRRHRGLRSMAPGGPAACLDSRLPISMAINSHPRADARAEGIKALLAGDLGNRFASMQSAGELSTGSGRFERVTSGLCRDASVLLAERICDGDWITRREHALAQVHEVGGHYLEELSERCRQRELSEKDLPRPFPVYDPAYDKRSFARRTARRSPARKPRMRRSRKAPPWRAIRSSSYSRKARRKIGTKW